MARGEAPRARRQDIEVGGAVMTFQAPPPCEPRNLDQQQISVEEIDAQLRDRVQGLVEHLRPPSNPGKRIGTRIEYGAKGGLKVEVAGKDRGRITPFDGDGKGRSPLHHDPGQRRRVG